MDTGKKVTIQYSKGQFTGFIGYDKVLLGSLTLHNVSVAVIETAVDFFSPNTNWQGILGLGYDSLLKVSVSVYLCVMCQSVYVYCVCLHLCSVPICLCVVCQSLCTRVCMCVCVCVSLYMCTVSVCMCVVCRVVCQSLCVVCQSVHVQCVSLSMCTVSVCMCVVCPSVCV